MEIEKVIYDEENIEDNFINSRSHDIIEEEEHSFNTSHISTSSIHFISDRQHIPLETLSLFDLIFLVRGNRIKQDMQKVLRCCPLIIKVLNNPDSKELKETTLVIDLPKEISENALNLFYTYDTISNQLKHSDILDIIIVAEYFENINMLIKIFKEQLIPSLNPSNVINCLLTASKKINNTLETNTNKTHILWRELMIYSREIISKQFYLIDKNDLYQFYNHDHKLFFLLLQQFFFINNCHISNHKGGYKQLFEAFGKIYKCDNLLVIISCLYKEKFLPKEIEELVTSSLPTMLDLKDAYKEYEINLDEKDKIIIVSTSYQQNSMKYNITINPSNTNSCYMYSVLFINDATVGISSKNFLTNFSKWSNYSIDASSSMNIRKKSKMYLHIKIDYIFTAFVNYLIKHIEEYTKSFHLIQTDISFILQLIFHMKANGINQNIILIIIIDWLKNADNTHEDNIIILSEQINWRDIKIELMTEYYIKYSHVIKKTLMNTLMKIFKENKIEKLINHLADNIGNTVYTNPSYKSENKKPQAIIKCSNVASIELLPQKKNNSLYFKGNKTGKNDFYTIGGNNEDTPTNSRGVSYLSTFTSQVAQFTANKIKNSPVMTSNNNLNKTIGNTPNNSDKSSNVVNELFHAITLKPSNKAINNKK